MSRRYVLTRAAEQDIIGILRETTQRFGPLQRKRYAQIIAEGAEMVADLPDLPDRPGSRSRAEIGSGVRTFHLEHAAGRLGGASHLLYYAPASDGVIILRVLHERMEPLLHLTER